MTHEQAAERRTLVRRVRAEFRPHFFTRCLEIAYRVIPCCESCEYNKTGFCAAPPLTFEHNRNGLAIKDGEALCLQWSPAPEAIIKALQYAYTGNNAQGEQAQPPEEPKTAKQDSKSAKIAELVHLIQAEEITAEQAAQTLGIATANFYAKARKIGLPLSVIPRKKRENPKQSEQIRRFHAGEITATEAAQNLGISVYTFYKKARAAKQKDKRNTT